MGLYGQAVAVIGSYEVQLDGEALAVVRLPDPDVTQLPLPNCAQLEQAWGKGASEALEGGGPA